MTPETPENLEAELRELFTGKVSLDVDAPPGTVAHVLARTRRARRRTTSVRAVTTVAALGAVGGSVVSVANGFDRSTGVSPGRGYDPRCQEYWSPPTPGPGETGEPFEAPTWGGETDPPILVDPSATDNPLPGMTEIPRPMRGPHGGVLCTVVDGRVELMARDGLNWPTELPVPQYSMLPGATPGAWNSPAPASSELREARERLRARMDRVTSPPTSTR